MTSVESSNTSLPQTSPKDVHPSAIGTNTKPETASTESGSNSQFEDKAAAGIDERPDAKEQGPGDEGSSGQTDENGYPTQRHAGKVGYGPNYSQKAVCSIRIWELFLNALAGFPGQGDWIERRGGREGQEKP